MSEKLENAESQSDKIIWQMQYDIPIINNAFSWGLRIVWATLPCYFFSLGLMKYIQQYDKMEWYKQGVIIGAGIVFVLIIWSLWSCILRTLNLKTIYATNDNLVIQKHFGKDIILPLGSFYIVFKTIYRAYETQYVTIQAFNDSISFTFGVAKNYKNFRSHGIKNIKEALGEYYRSFNKRAFVNNAQKLIPSLRKEDIEPIEAGVRAQAMLSDGTLLDDFVFEKGKHSLHVLNAPSPAATCSIEIGKAISKEFEQLSILK